MNSDSLVGVTLPDSGFNPHSPLLANELIALRQKLLQHTVSIHIRHCWRMNLSQQPEALRLVNVSIHIRHCWRMNSGSAKLNLVAVGVSIHIRHCWRMNLALTLGWATSLLFQSTFAIAGE